MSYYRTIVGRGFIIAMTAALLHGFTSVAWSQVAGGGRSFGGELRGITQFTGEVVCVGCSLEEAQKVRARSGDLYLLKHQEGQVVLSVDAFQDAAEHARWQSIVGLSHQLTVRAPERVFHELTAEANLFKKVIVTGLLRSDRTFDINSVQVSG